MPVQVGRLRWKLEGGHQLDDDELRFVVGLMLDRRGHRERKRRKAEKQRLVAMTVHNLEAVDRSARDEECADQAWAREVREARPRPITRESAVAEAMAIHGVGRKYVFDALAMVRDIPVAVDRWNVAGVERRFVLGRDLKWRESDVIRRPAFSGA